MYVLLYSSSTSITKHDIQPTYKKKGYSAVVYYRDYRVAR